MSLSNPPPPEPAINAIEPLADDSNAINSTSPWAFPPRSGYLPSTSASDATTPPNRSKVMPKDTPIHYKTIAAKVHAAANKVVRDKEYIEIGRDMYEHIVGSVPTKEFLSDVMAVESGDTNVQLHAIGKVKKEKDLVRFFKLNSKAFPSLKLRDSHKKSIRTPYSDVLRLPDWMLYGSDDEHELPGELKPNPGDDPFVDPPEGVERHEHLFVKETEAAMMIVGQLVAYAALMFEIQPRTHVYSFLVCGQIARLLRWDRAGCIVSESFAISNKDNYLAQFFLRYHLMSAEARGHDPSVRFDLTDEEKASAEKLFRKQEGATDAECNASNFRRVVFLDDSKVDPEGAPVLQQFIVTWPRVVNESVEGAATRGAMAIHLDGAESKWKVTYLKDTHRYDSDDGCELEKEGKTYERLHTAGVRAIPKHVCSGDAAGKWQHTRTDRYLHYACAGVTLFGRQHYYTALGDIGRPLTSFKSTRELVKVMLDAIVAHTDAYTKANLLHRDISAGNILITERGGLLIDWQFARKVRTDDNRQPRMEWRVGTWQFYSYALHSQERKATHDLRDDLESFVWVLLYMLVRYRPIRLDATTTLWYLFTTFDVSLSYTADEGRTRYYGGDKKLGFLRGDNNSFGRSAIYQGLPLPVRDLLVELQNLFAKLYPVGVRKAHITENDSAALLAQTEPEVPKEVYLGHGYTNVERELAKAEWRRTHALTPTATPTGLRRAATMSGSQPPAVDYTPVETHTNLHNLFEEAVEAGDVSWNIGHDGPAEDQVPALQRKFMKTQPNAAQISPTDLSSQLSSRTSSKRGRGTEENPAEPDSKKRKMASPSASRVTTRSGSSRAYKTTGKVALPPEKVGEVEADMNDFSAQMRAKIEEDAAIAAAPNEEYSDDEYDGESDAEEASDEGDEYRP